MNKLEYLAASVSALALVSSAASAAVTGPGGHLLSQEEIAQLPVQRDMNRQRPFYVLLKPGAAGAAAVVEAYFRGFGFRTEYFPDTNSVKLWGSYFQVERAANLNYVPGPDAITPLVINRKPSFPDPVQGAILATTFNPGPIMQSQITVTPSVPTTIPTHDGVLGLAPSDYAAIYGYGNLYKAGINGKGETVDIAACFGYNSSFLASFQSVFGLSPAPNVTVVGSTAGSSVEANLDVQRVYATAPGAAIRFFFNTTCSFGAFTTTFIDIHNDQKAHPAAAFTVSYGLPELYLNADGMGSVLTLADLGLSLITGGAAQKVALFAASGDTGDESVLENQALGPTLAPFGQADVLFFASDPHVLAVGGTNLILNKSFTRLAEFAWSGSSEANIDGGSGGGVSNTLKIPSWQVGVAGIASHEIQERSGRGVDGCAELARALMYEGAVTWNGGTSAASPTWAATVALAETGLQIRSTREGHDQLARLFLQQDGDAELLHRHHGRQQRPFRRRPWIRQRHRARRRLSAAFSEALRQR